MAEHAATARDWDVASDLARLQALLDPTPPASDTERPASVEPTAAEAEEHIRKLAIPARELDILVDRVGELGIAQSRLAALSTRRGDAELRDVAEEVERLAGLLRDQVLGLRMLPIKVSFPKYRRLVRDTCAALGKEAELIMTPAARASAKSAP